MPPSTKPTIKGIKHITDSDKSRHENTNIIPWNHNDLTIASGAPTAAGDPVGYTWDADKSEYTVYRGNDGHIHELWLWFNNCGWRHNDLTIAAGAPAAAGDPAGYTWDVDKSEHVIYRDNDAHVHELWFNGQNSPAQSQSAT